PPRLRGRDLRRASTREQEAAAHQEKPPVPGWRRMMNTFFPESPSGHIADDEGNGLWRSKHAYCVGTSQKPDATRVAGLYAWNQLGRKVKKGERGIRILAPVIGIRRKKDE